MSLPLLRHSRLDAILIAGSLVHGALLLAFPATLVVAIGLWWNANTVAHNFLHLPFFRSREANRAYSVYLSVLLGLPQSLWRQRHLAHHRERPFVLRVDRELVLESLVVLSLWTVLIVDAPSLFWRAYLPGWLLGLTLCSLQGHYEHARGTTSHYGRIYNLLFFNDGYHVEHHRTPGRHWSKLFGRSADVPSVSRWPPVLRWLDAFTLDGLERIVLHSTWLQRVVVRVHERAFKAIVSELETPRCVAIVGGGLFPRTAILTRRFWPDAELQLIDVNARHLETVQPWMDENTVLICSRFDASAAIDADLVIVPLAYRGDRRRLYEWAASQPVIVHDWIWNKRGRSVIVSPWLLKRVNLILPSPRPAHARAS